MSRRLQKPKMREWFEDLRADYSAANESRFRRRRTGISSVGSSADYHYSSESKYIKMLEYARDMDRNDVMIGQVIDRAVINTIQDGFTLDVDTGDAGLDKELTDRWREWSTEPELCDIAGEMAFVDMERLILRSIFVDGDIFAIPTNRGTLELIECHRCRSPQKTKKNIVLGVEMDQNRRRVRYWFTKDDIMPYGGLRLKDLTPRPARDSQNHKAVLHCYIPKRVSQTRGVTALAPIFDAVGMHDDIQFAKLLQQQIVSCFAIIRNRSSEYIGGSGSFGTSDTDTAHDGSSRTLEGIGPGMDIPSAVGETITGFSPNIPNPEFFEHVIMILRFIGANLGMPLCMMILDTAGETFHGYRGSVDQARLGFRSNQRLLIRRFHREIYRWKLLQWIAEDADLGRASVSGNYDLFRHTWHPPTWPYIDKLKDGGADLLIQRNALNSPRRIQAERGRDIDTVSSEIVQDNGSMIRKALVEAKEINTEYPEAQVHWREIISLPTPDGVQVALTASTSDQEGDRGNNKNRETNRVGNVV